MFAGVAIRKLTVFPLVIHLDAAESTKDARGALEGILYWAKDQFGLNYSSSTISRWAYVSDVVFETDFPLLGGLNEALNSASRTISELVQGNLKEELQYVPSKIVIGHDPSKRSGQVASFSIEHRVLQLFEENVYHSEAPIPTDEHISLLIEIEKAMRKGFESREKTIRQSSPQDASA